MQQYYGLTFKNPEELVDFKGEVRKQMYVHALDCYDLQHLTGYSTASIRKWFSQRAEQSSRFLSAELANVLEIDVSRYKSCH